MKTIFTVLICLLLASVAEAQFLFFGDKKNKSLDNQTSLSEDSTSVTISYRTRHDLLILPAIINDTVKVNLIVDPRCKTLILFGKKFEKELRKSKTLPTAQSSAVHHKVEIGPAVRQEVPIVVVRNIDPMNFFMDIHGVIGSEMIASCDIEFDHRNQRMTMKVLDDQELTARANNLTPNKTLFESTLPYKIQKFYAAPMIYRAMGSVPER